MTQIEHLESFSKMILRAGETTADLLKQYYKIWETNKSIKKTKHYPQMSMRNFKRLFLKPKTLLPVWAIAYPIFTEKLKK